MPEASPPQAFLDDFFTSYYLHRPVNATFIGVHDHDHRLPDLSENGVGDALADAEALLRRSEALEAAPRTPAEDVDLRLARGFLRIQKRELGSFHFHEGNPSAAMGEAVFGVMSLFLTDFAPTSQRAEAAVARLDGIPTLLKQARTGVRAAPSAWTRRALEECVGAEAFLGDGIDLLGLEVPAWADRLRAAADRAAAAVGAYAAWLRTDVRAAPADAVACGEETFSAYLRDGHFLEEAADELAAYARAELARAQAGLEAGAPALGAASPEEALARLRDIHPEADGYYDRYQSCWDEVRTLVLDHDLVTWPDHPVRFVPRPAWTRAAAPHLYFLFYRSPAAFGRPDVHRHLVAPLEEGLSPEEERAFLEANNESVIKLNHVVHHAGPGHHVQNAHAHRAPSRIGRVAAVDCAARIAMFCGGTMAEGWACYATDLVREAGGVTELEAYAELRSRTRMCARAVVDVELHAGRMSLDGAAAFYCAEAGFPSAAATAEATKNSLFPGAAMMYMAGSDAIHRLRRETEAREGSSFRLRDFHDRLLSWGSIPVTLAGALLDNGPDDAAPRDPAA